jgi:hypothetical protein
MINIVYCFEARFGDLNPHFQAKEILRLWRYLCPYPLFVHPWLPWHFLVTFPDTIGHRALVRIQFRM